MSVYEPTCTDVVLAVLRQQPDNAMRAQYVLLRLYGLKNREKRAVSLSAVQLALKCLVEQHKAARVAPGWYVALLENPL